MTVPIEQIREDFDRIAVLNEHVGGERDLYHDYLLNCLPSHCESALEIGCGTGAFTRLLAGRAQRVLGVDLSTEMLRLAEQRSAQQDNITYLHGDIMQLQLPAESYDCIVSISTLHHLPTGEALGKIKSLLKPCGTLIIQDLVADDGLFDFFRSALACFVSVTTRFYKTGRLRPPKQVRAAWAEHGKGEVYPTLKQVHEMCERHLPQARVHRHLLWRYTLVWHKPSR